MINWSGGSMTVVSLFSGCGGLDLGFKQAGFDIVWANDFNVDAQIIYNMNIGEIDGRDIVDIPSSDIPESDVITAGFPCQPFSSAGKRRGVMDSRGKLYQDCLRIVKDKHPKVFLFENVKGLLSSKFEDGKSLVETISSDLTKMGYNVSYEVLNASDYAVPQNRQRLFIVGIRKDLRKDFVFPPKIRKHNLTLRHVLDIPAWVANQVDYPLSPSAAKMVKYIPSGGSWKDVPYDELSDRFKRIRDNMKKYHSPKFYRRHSMDEICGTITATAQPEMCAIIHPAEDRKFNIREVARIQSFPDNFLFLDDTPRNVAAMYKVIGNAVPPTLAKHMASQIKKLIFND